MIDVRLMVISRSAPATSAPRLNASFTTARNAKRKSATAKEPRVNIRRTFLRKRLARINRLNFMRDLLQSQQGAPQCLPQVRPFQDAASYLRERQRPDRELPSARFCHACLRVLQSADRKS